MTLPAQTPQERWESVEHGTTYGMAQRCYRLNPEGRPCAPCRAVMAAYMANWRASKGEGAEHERMRRQARTRALWQLSRLYPAAYRRLVEEETEKIKSGAVLDHLEWVQS